MLTPCIPAAAFDRALDEVSKRHDFAKRMQQGMDHIGTFNEEEEKEEEDHDDDESTTPSSLSTSSDTIDRELMYEMSEFAANIKKYNVTLVAEGEELPKEIKDKLASDPDSVRVIHVDDV